MKNERNSGPALFIPTLDDIAKIRVGELAPDCFGRMARIVDVACIKADIHGAMFACYSTAHGPRSSISMSIKVGKLTRTVATSRAYTSAELDAIEREMNAAGERLRGEFGEAQS